MEIYAKCVFFMYLCIDFRVKKSVIRLNCVCCQTHTIFFVFKTLRKDTYFLFIQVMKFNDFVKKKELFE